MNKIVDCHYCEWAGCSTATSETVNCFVEDYGYFSREVKDSEKEAKECKNFFFDGTFPKD